MTFLFLLLLLTVAPTPLLAQPMEEQPAELPLLDPLPDQLRIKLVLDETSATYALQRAGVLLTATDFALLARDRALQARLEHERRLARRTGVAMAVSGLGLAVGSFLMASRDMDDKLRYYSATSWEGRARAKADAALALGLAGTGLIVSAPWPSFHVRERQRHLARYLDLNAAQAGIERHETALRMAIETRTEQDEAPETLAPPQ